MNYISVLSFSLDFFWLNILPGFLDYQSGFWGVDVLRHEQEAADLHDVPVGFPGVALDAGQGGVYVGAEQRGVRASHQVSVEQSGVSLPGLDLDRGDVVAAIKIKVLLWQLLNKPIENIVVSSYVY